MDAALGSACHIYDLFWRNYSRPSDQQQEHKIKKDVENAFCCSYFRSTVCNIAVAAVTFSQIQGIVNSFCKNIGLVDLLQNLGWIKANYIPFLSDPVWAKITIVVINIWVGVPYLMLIATGVLMNIPEELKESAKIDGANSFQIFRKITMPYMLFITGPYLVTQFTANINNFNVIYLLTQDIYTTTNQKLAASWGKEIDLLVTWLYRLTSEQYNYKMASVIGICVFIVCAVITLFAFNFLIKGDKEDTFR